MLKEAIPILKETIRKSPTDPERHFLLGKCFLYLDQLPQAYESFDRAISLNRDYSTIVGDTLFNIASALIDKGKVDNAYRFFRLASEKVPALKENISKFYYDRGMITPIQNSLKVVSLLKAATEFSRIHNKDISGYLYDSGIKLQSSNDLNGAIIFFEKCASLFPKKRLSISEHMLKTAEEIIVSMPDNAIRFLKLSSQFDQSAGNKITALIKDNSSSIVKNGGATTVNFLYSFGRSYRKDKMIFSKLIYRIAQKEEKLESFKSFSAFYTKATALNKELSRCPEIECAYYSALNMWIQGSEKKAENEFYKMFKKSPNSQFVKKLQKHIAPNGDITHLKPKEKKLVSTVYNKLNFFWLSTGKVELSTSEGEKEIVSVNNGVYYTGLGKISREGTKVFLRNPTSKPVSIFYVLSSGISYN